MVRPALDDCVEGLKRDLTFVQQQSNTPAKQYDVIDCRRRVHHRIPLRIDATVFGPRRRERCNRSAIRLVGRQPGILRRNLKESKNRPAGRWFQLNRLGPNPTLL